MDVSGSLKNQWSLVCNETFSIVFQKVWKSSKEENVSDGWCVDKFSVVYSCKL